MDQISDDLLGRYFTRQCTRKEKNQIKKWLNASEENKKYFIELIYIWHKVKENPEEDLINIDETCQKLLARIDQSQKQDGLNSVSSGNYSKGRVYLALIRAAAIFIIVLSLLTGSYLFYRYKSQLAILDKKELPAKTIEGKLILADGTSVSLGTEDSELTYNKTGTEILFKGDTIKNVDARNKKEHTVAYNEIIIPKGQKLKLLLPDNSLVWLNSASSLKFPLYFGKDERKVILTGEAYFEIKEDISKPFKVHTSQMLIEVLGTSFNISSYDDDDFIEATLVSGSLKVINKNKSKAESHIILKPEQKAKMYKDDMKISVEKVDVELYTSWKDGYFKFQSTSFDNIAKKLSRNYGINISIISEELKAEQFSGKLWQMDNIEDVLKYIQISTPISYNIKEDYITISNTN